MADTAVKRQTVSALRETIGRIETRTASGVLAALPRDDAFAPAGERRLPVPLGVPEIDIRLGGGLPAAGLMEIRLGETRDSGVATGFLLALSSLFHKARRESGMAGPPLLWITQADALKEAGHLYGPGLAPFGFGASDLVLGTAPSLADVLWIAETALAGSFLSGVILEIRGNPKGLALAESRRLHVRARAAGVPLLIFRQAGAEEASSAIVRFRIDPAPARLRTLPDGTRLAGSLGNPVFSVTLEKLRGAPPFNLLLEWNSDESRFLPVIDDTPSLAPAHPVDPFPLSARRPRGPAEMGPLLALPRAS